MSIDTATGKEAPAEISSERVKDIFSSIAKKYERFNAVSSFGAYKSWLAGMMRQAPIEPTDDVLDIAGGTGDVTFTVARAKHPRHIQCTDLVNEMLDVARAHYADGAACGVPVDFEVVDAQNIPYADASYDALTMAYGIRNMPDRPRALSEMLRVLKPGGHLVCLEFSEPRGPREDDARGGVRRRHLEELHRRHRRGACGEKARVTTRTPQRDAGRNDEDPAA